jgi:hypothetical protein
MKIKIESITNMQKCDNSKQELLYNSDKILYNFD